MDSYPVFAQEKRLRLRHCHDLANANNGGNVSLVPPLFICKVGVKTRVNTVLGRGRKRSGRAQVWVNSRDLLIRDP